MGISEGGHLDDVLHVEGPVDEVLLEERLKVVDEELVGQLEDLGRPLPIHRRVVEGAQVAEAEDGSHRLGVVELGDLDDAGLRLLRLRVGEHRVEDGRTGHQRELVSRDSHASDLKLGEGALGGVNT